MSEAEQDNEDNLPSRIAEIDAARDAREAQLAAREATTPTIATGASFTAINLVAGNLANVVDPVLQAFFPNRNFSAGNFTIRQNVWPKRAPARNKDKPDSGVGNRSQRQQNLSNHITEANHGPSGAHIQDLVSQHPKISHQSCDSGSSPMPSSEPGSAVVSQAGKPSPQAPDDIISTKASTGSACGASVDAVRTFNSQFTIQKRPRTVFDLPSAKRSTSTGIPPNVQTSLSTSTGAQASKLLKRGTKREADCIHSPTADPSSNDALPRKTSSRLAAKVQPSNVYPQKPSAADPDELTAMADDEFKPPSSRKIASGLAPAKRVWKKSEQPLEKTKETTNATLKAPEAVETGDAMSTYSSLAPTRTPNWYKDIIFTSRSEITLKRDDILTVRRLKTIYATCLTAQSHPNTNDLLNNQNSLRTFLHQLGLFDFHGKEKEIIKKSTILTDGTLTGIIESPTIPRDIRDVAEVLEARWWRGDTDPDLLRGILRSKSFKAKTSNTASSLTSYTTYTLDATYPFRIPADKIGHNGLHVGAWWPLQLCAVRDGAHGDSEAGIHGHQDAGAFSIVVSGGGYANVDNGDMLEYCGTASSTKEMTPNTRLLITSFENKRPVRVLRSAKGDRKWSPSVGVRYDGLYVVTSWKVIDESVSLVRFTMVRSREQEDMRCEGPGRRPHAVEVEAVRRDREMRRVTA